MKEYEPVYPNDKKGPRMKKGKFSNLVITKELMKRFKKKYPEYKGMKWKEFYEGWEEIAFTIRQEAITNPLGMKLGVYNGEIKYQYLPYKPKAINHAASQEIGEKVVFVNIVTKNKTSSIIWERKEAEKYNPMLGYYAFEATRELTKLSKDYTLTHPESIRVATLKGGRKKK